LPLAERFGESFAVDASRRLLLSRDPIALVIEPVLRRDDPGPAAEQVKMDREAAPKLWRLSVEQASYAASLAERRYRAVADEDTALVRRLAVHYPDTVMISTCISVRPGAQYP